MTGHRIKGQRAVNLSEERFDVCVLLVQPPARAVCGQLQNIIPVFFLRHR